MSVIVTNKKGKKVTLLNPSEKGAKYANELKYKFKLTNDGRPKLTKDNAQITLTKTQKAYRAGYLDAQKDSAKAYKAKNKKRG